MDRIRPLLIAALAATLIGAPAQAQSAGFYRAQDVAFFDEVQLGQIAVTPVGVITDKRCPDLRLCGRDERMIISVIVDDGDFRREVVLELGEPVQIDGGLLLLADPGVAPKWNGAIRLRRYNLDLRFIPLADEDARFAF